MDTITLTTAPPLPVALYTFAFPEPGNILPGLPPGFSDGSTVNGPKYDGKMGGGYIYAPVGGDLSTVTPTTPAFILVVKKRGGGYLPYPYTPVNLDARIFGASASRNGESVYLGLPGWFGGITGGTPPPATNPFLPKVAYSGILTNLITSGTTPISGVVYKPENETQPGTYAVELRPPTDGSVFPFADVYGVWDVYDIRPTFNYGQAYSGPGTLYFPRNGWCYRAAVFQITDGSGGGGGTITPGDCCCHYSRVLDPPCTAYRDATPVCSARRGVCGL